MRNTSGKKIAQIAFFSVFILFIATYAFFRSKDLIFGVKIRDVTMNGALSRPAATFNDPILKLSGNAENAINLILNGREIPIDKEGNFSETIALLSGYNIINITAKDKFGNVDEKNYQVIYEVAAPGRI